MITVNENTEILTPILIGDIENTEFPPPYRAFDFEAGDERRFLREEAIALARLRVRDRGCRQLVRQNERPAGDDHLLPRWIIQDV